MAMYLAIRRARVSTRETKHAHSRDSEDHGEHRERRG
jgi:hypothetical protein